MLTFIQRETYETRKVHSLMESDWYCDYCEDSSKYNDLTKELNLYDGPHRFYWFCNEVCFNCWVLSRIVNETD